MTFVRVSVWNPDPEMAGLIHYKHVFDVAKWRLIRSGLTEFDCEDTELAEIHHQAAQLGMAVIHRPCGP